MTLDVSVALPTQVVRSRTDNPLWEIVRHYPSGDPPDLASFRGWRPTSYGMYWEGDAYQHNSSLPSRTYLCRRYSWAVPCPDALEWMCWVLDGRPVVEVGAGTGYWAWQLEQLGVDVLAYDKAPPDTHFNGYHAPLKRAWHEYTDEDRRRKAEWRRQAAEVYEMLAEAHRLRPDLVPPAPLPDDSPLSGGEWMEKPDPSWRAAPYVPVIQGDVNVAARHPERVLFLCWPPYAQDMGVTALRAYTGNSLILIGEGSGGCTGDEEMFDVLDEQWNQVSYCPSHVQWDGINDEMTYWTRRRAIGGS